MKKRTWVICFVLVLAAGRLFYGLCIRERASRECAPFGGQTCQVCYLLNLDGMKGLGHSALLLVDEEGEGQIFSYNGMQYSLPQCLLGKEGIGRMTHFSLDKEAVALLWETGDVETEDFEECDNFDRILYRYISREQYDRIVREGEYYKNIGDTFENLYAALYGPGKDGSGEEDVSEAQARMDSFLGQEEIPRYQIYTHNCDTVARELMALADDGVAAYNVSEKKLTPNGNYKEMCEKLDEAWGYQSLGEDSPVEKLLDL